MLPFKPHDKILPQQHANSCANPTKPSKTSPLNASSIRLQHLTPNRHEIAYSYLARGYHIKKGAGYTVQPIPRCDSSFLC